MLLNTRERWGSAAKTFHWLIAALVVAEIPVGYLMSYSYGLAIHDKAVAPLQTLTSQIHHTLGLSILALVIVRLARRLRGLSPDPPPDRFRHQHRLASLNHAALYAVLLALPLSGWAALSVYGQAPIWLFGVAGAVPPILPRLPANSPFGYGFFAPIHVWALYIGGGLLSVHVAAALWGHWGLRDNTLLRMWPLARPDPARRDPPAPSDHRL